MNARSADSRLYKNKFPLSYNSTSWNLKWLFLIYALFGVAMALIFKSGWYLVIGCYLGSYMYVRNAVAKLTGVFLPEFLITNAGWYTSSGRYRKDRAITREYHLILVRDPLTLFDFLPQFVIKKGRRWYRRRRLNN